MSDLARSFLRRTKCAAALLALLASARFIQANVVLAPLFSDHAVLQRDKPAPIWGHADAGEKVTVSFAGQTRSTIAGNDGRWIVLLDALPATTTSAELTVAGRNALVIHDVVVGEVWICSGQSNMEFAVAPQPGWQERMKVKPLNSEAEIAAAHFPLLRHVRIEHQVATSPADSVSTSGWKPATPENVGEFTAVGYFFGRDLQQKLGVPVGLIDSSWGGTPIESWLSPAALDQAPEFAWVREKWEQNLAAYPALKADYESRLATWTAAEAAAKAGPKAAYSAWLKQHPKPRGPRGPGDPWTPAGLFNGMINPLLPYALRGVVWYQGESNADHAESYHALFAAMITAWRGHFGQGDIPFYWVNLANYTVPSDTTGQTYAFLREAQTQTLSLPNTGQALAIDIGDPTNIHPANKQEVGRRLALLAKNRVYGITSDDTGPTFAGATREGAALRVRFDHVSGGLIAHDQPPQPLEIAGVDLVFHPATAKIDRDTLLVSAPEVKEPVAVRYAWKNAPEANLYNGAGLPATPFRSDNW
jgi:sialate O-acetylesterase